MKRVLFTATVVKKHINEFHIPYLQMFKECGWETAVAARNDYEEPGHCVIPFCDHYYDIPFERSPFNTSNIQAYKVLKEVIDEGRYDIIHCHTPVGAVLTRVAARKSQKSGTRVIYTAHGFHFYDGAPLKNWLLYYPVERFLSRWTDTLITINKEDYERAKKRFHAGKTVYMPGVGVDLSKFEGEFTELDREAKRKELGVPHDATLLMSVGELNRNKNHEVVIRALKELNNPNVHYCIAGTGPLREYLIQLADKLRVGPQVHLLGYRNDVPQLYKTADICCFPSFREGLPVALLEAIACGLPVIATDNRGTRDIVVREENGILCSGTDAEAFAQAIQKVIERPGYAEMMENHARRTVTGFSIEKALDTIREIYQL